MYSDEFTERIVKITGQHLTNYGQEYKGHSFMHSQHLFWCILVTETLMRATNYWNSVTELPIR